MWLYGIVGPKTSLSTRGKLMHRGTTPSETLETKFITNLCQISRRPGYYGKSNGEWGCCWWGALGEQGHVPSTGSYLRTVQSGSSKWVRWPPFLSVHQGSAVTPWQEHTVWDYHRKAEPWQRACVSFLNAVGAEGHRVESPSPAGHTVSLSRRSLCQFHLYLFTNNLPPLTYMTHEYVCICYGNQFSKNMYIISDKRQNSVEEILKILLALFRDSWILHTDRKKPWRAGWYRRLLGRRGQNKEGILVKNSWLWQGHLP